MSERHEHESLLMRRDLTAIIGAWPALLARLAAGGSSDRSGVRRPPGSRTPIDAHVSDVIAEVTEWVVFLAHVLVDEADWTPPADTSTPALLGAIRERVGHFTEHPDQMLAVGIIEDADRLARLTLRTATPARRRTVRLGIPCGEHTTSDTGGRVPCGGQYAMDLRDDERLSDLVCTHDPTHRMTPDAWFRGQRHGAYDARAVDELVRSVRRVGGSGA